MSSWLPPEKRLSCHTAYSSRPAAVRSTAKSGMMSPVRTGHAPCESGSGQGAFGSGSTTPTVWSELTIVGLLSHVWPLSCERRIATLPPRVPWAFLCPLSRVEPVDQRPVGQHDDLVGDRLVLRLGVEDRAGRLPGRTVVGAAREPRGPVEADRPLERPRARVARSARSAGPRPRRRSSRVGRVGGDALLVVEVVAEHAAGCRTAARRDRSTSAAVGRAAGQHRVARRVVVERDRDRVQRPGGAERHPRVRSALVVALVAPVPPAQLLNLGALCVQVRPPSVLTPASRPCAPPSDQRSCCQNPTTLFGFVGLTATEGSTSAVLVEHARVERLPRPAAARSERARLLVRRGRRRSRRTDSRSPVPQARRPSPRPTPWRQGHFAYLPPRSSVRADLVDVASTRTPSCR